MTWYPPCRTRAATWTRPRNRRRSPRYLAATGVAEAPFRAAYALIGAQRALRILGVFARLAIRDGKPRYLAFMPRVWAHLQRDLAHPALAPLRAMLANVPAPDAALRERIARCRP